jgi:ATP-dependent DNA helicase HFM1/MER3
MILGRAAPFGRQVLERAEGFPKVRVGIKIADKLVFTFQCRCSAANHLQDIQAGKGAKLNLVAEVAFMNDRPPETFKYRPVFVVFLAETSDGQLIHFARFRLVSIGDEGSYVDTISSKKLGTSHELRFFAYLTSSTQSILCHAMCDEFGWSSLPS